MARPMSNPKRRRPADPPPELTCPACGEELAVWWRGRAWCVLCEAEELDAEPPRTASGRQAGLFDDEPPPRTSPST